MSNATLVPWERVLWRRQPYPDSYVADDFLAKLRTNASVRRPSFGALVLAALPIVQQLSLILLFLGLYTHLLLARLSAGTLGIVSLALLTFSYCLSKVLTLDAPSSTPKAKGRLVGLALLAVLLFALSPILRTLSGSTTSDSVWALSFILFFVHFALAPYSSGKSAHPPSGVRVALSLNASTAAVVVLSSRLISSSGVFTLLLASSALFAALPRSARPLAPRHRAVLVVALIIPTLTLLLTVSLSAGAAAAAALVFVGLVAPAWMRHAQSWKNELSGPWDPAVPRLNSTRR